MQNYLYFDMDKKNVKMCKNGVCLSYIKPSIWSRPEVQHSYFISDLSLELFLKFNKILSLTTEVGLIAKALSSSKCLEVGMFSNH